MMATAGLGAEAPRWNLAKKIAFRFAFVLFFVHLISPFNQLSTLFWYWAGLLESARTLCLNVVSFVSEHVFGATITALPLGSGDTTFNYVEWFCFVAIAVVGTAIWTVADRRRPSYPRLSELLRASVRLYVAYFMIMYGAAKVVPTQFGTVSPSRLVEHVGDMSPMGILWTFMAASPVYTVFGGAAEIVGGILLVFRRTALLGALVSAGVMAQVVMLNFCYDVPVKLFSSSLLVMAILYVLPDAKRLFDVVVLRRAVAAAPFRPRFQRRWLNWAVAGLTTCLFTYVTVEQVKGSYELGKMVGYFGAQPPLAGIWNVVEFERDGHVVPPLATDASRWKQLIVDNSPYGAVMRIDAMTGPIDGRLMELQQAARQITLSDGRPNPQPPIKLAYEQPSPSMLVLSGNVGGQNVRVKLELTPRERFLLLNRGFHWINEFPFNN